MKQFNLTEKTSVEASRDSGKSNTPQADIYIPSYKGINHLLYKAGGDGSIAYNDALAAEGKQALDHMLKMDTALKGGNAMIDINAQMNRESDSYLEQHPDGDGYTLAMTSKYKELSERSASDAATSEIRDYILLNSRAGLDDWANKAFKAENVRKTSATITATENNNDVLKNQVRINPELYESLTPVYASQVENLKTLTGINYAEYYKKAMEEWNVSYAEGLMDKNPVMANNMLKSGRFGKELSSEKLNYLLNKSDALIKHDEDREKRRKHEQEQVFYKSEQLAISELELGFAKGTMSDADVLSYFEDGRITEITKNKQITHYEHVKQSQNKKMEVKTEIAKSLQNGVPTEDITASQKADYFEDYFKSIKEQKGVSASLYEKVIYAKEHSITYDHNIPSLRDAIVTNITINKDPKAVMDACIAISGNENVPAIKGLDKDLQFFSSYAINHFKGTNDVQGLIELRDKFFAPVDKHTEEYRNTEWKNQKYARDASETEAFLERNKFDTEGWIFTNVPETIKNSLIRENSEILERMYKKTGSITIAENIANDLLAKNFAISEINGKKEKLFNPPRKDNVGLPDFVIKNLVSDRGQKLIEAIEKAGDKYKGYIPVKKYEDFISKSKSLDELYKVPLSSKNKRINAYIDGNWETRDLRIEANPKNNTTYSYYFLIDESDSESKEYLINPQTNTRAIIDFSIIKVKK